MEFTLHLSDNALVGYSFLALVWIIIMSAVLYTLYHAWSVQSWFSRHNALSVTTDGEIVSCKNYDDSSNVTYRFSDADGDEVHAVMDISCLPESGFVAGNKIRVTYCRDNPVLSYIEPYRAHYYKSATGVTWFMGAMMCFMIFLVWKTVFG